MAYTGEEKREYQRRYYHRNRKKGKMFEEQYQKLLKRHRVSNKKWRQSEKGKETYRKWVEANREKLSAYQRKYSAARGERIAKKLEEKGFGRYADIFQKP